MMNTSTSLIVVILAQFLVVSRGELMDDILGTDNQLVGAQPGTISKYPYQVSVQYNGSHHCGGSILTQTKILTAAHCIYGPNGVDFSLTEVLAGVTELSSNGQRVAVLLAHVHESYNPTLKINDVAVLDIEPLRFNNFVRPIQLAENYVYPNEYAYVTGWGRTAFGNFPPSNTLQRLNVLTYERQYCSEQMNETIYDSQLCTLAGFNRGTCNGDSGGPVVLFDSTNCKKQIQIGIVSFGVRCASGFPDVASYVPYFKNWIDSKVRL